LSTEAPVVAIDYAKGFSMKLSLFNAHCVLESLLRDNSGLNFETANYLAEPFVAELIAPDGEWDFVGDQAIPGIDMILGDQNYEVKIDAGTKASHSGRIPSGCLFIEYGKYQSSVKTLNIGTIYAVISAEPTLKPSGVRVAAENSSLYCIYHVSTRYLFVFDAQKLANALSSMKQVGFSGAGTAGALFEVFDSKWDLITKDLSTAGCLSVKHLSDEGMVTEVWKHTDKPAPTYLTNPKESSITKETANVAFDRKTYTEALKSKSGIHLHLTGQRGTKTFEYEEIVGKPVFWGPDYVVVKGLNRH
jgi:hypothetical protein